MVVYAAGGDPSRSMALLWRADAPVRSKASPGPVPALSVDGIVDAAIAVADDVGMDGLSMRAVGERLGRTGMALYTYVGSKRELLDLMYDQVLAELPAEYDLTAGWRAALTSWAKDAFAVYVAHPWMLQVSQVRPVLGPHEYASLEALLRILHDAGLRGPQLRPIAGAVLHFVRGASRTAAESREAAQVTGVSDEDWWADRSVFLAKCAPDFAERFPLVAGLEPGDESPTADSSTPYIGRLAQEMFEAGLAIILDGTAIAAGNPTP